MKRYILLFAILASIFSGCTKTDEKEQFMTYQKKINEIYVYHSELGLHSPEYKIDLKNKQFWEFVCDWSNKELRIRDSSSENEGFTYVCDLDQEKIDDFIRKSSRYGFTLWDNSYYNNNIEDGHQWGIIITYFDSSQYKITGSNEYPETWDKMLKAFEDLTGSDILIFNSDWLEY